MVKLSEMQCIVDEVVSADGRVDVLGFGNEYHTRHGTTFEEGEIKHAWQMLAAKGCILAEGDRARNLRVLKLG